MWTTELPPFVPFFVAALLAPLLPRRARAAMMLLVPVTGIVQLAGVDAGTVVRTVFLDFDLTPFRVDRLSRVFGYLFHIAAFLGILFALHVHDLRQQVSALLYAGSALGAVFAGDLLTLFVFWELLAVSSTFLILASDSERSRRAAMRYLVIHVSSGMLLLAGSLMWFRSTGTLDFEYIGLESVAGGLILLAFGIKSAFPFLHNWLTDAYPQSTPTGTVFLSAFSTKVAVYALVRGYPGTEILIYIGAVMACFPIFYAVIENDLRRVLTYSMINQIGYMVVGVGIGTEVALNGTVSHVFAHVIYKALLLMSMGAVLQMTGRINGSDLGGLYKSMPWTTTFCIIGAASISAFPLFSGFISKSMVMSEALKGGYTMVWMMLLFAAAGVFHHAGIKIPFFAFFYKDAGLRPGEAPANMLTAMALAALLCIGIGVYPSALYDLLPFDTGYWPYDATHVLAQLQLLLFSAAAFAWLKLSGIYPPELRSTNIDVEWTYRKLAPKVLARTAALIGVLDRAFRRAVLAQFRHAVFYLQRHHGPQGILARTWPTGSMTLWVAIILATTLVLYYVQGW
ncbi:MAG: Na(+)/H(+) antiporter subunit D [Proteobacteria bacterium]|nr:MAG: Na(+)/H(+) antiporter subunit D [Pseudomonadota bacterium]